MIDKNTSLGNTAVYDEAVSWGVGGGGGGTKKIPKFLLLRDFLYGL